MKNIKTHKQVGFSHNALHTQKHPHALFYIKQKTSFWIATLSVFMFVVGNMVGQNGMYAFFASVLGEQDNTAIAYTGTVLPVEQVIDYGCWARYGGDYKVHTYRQAPQECYRAMPTYRTGSARDEVFSMGYMSSYTETTEGSGTHDGIDIRVPVGTPVLAAMNGRVVQVGNQPRGYGQYIVIEHPDVPDPKDPQKKTVTLYTVYAHLSSVYVEEGNLLQKGTRIALSGNTGASTGPHLHFQIDREDAPFHPYYPSNQQDGYTYTVQPMYYVQSNYESTASTLVASDRGRETQTSVVTVPSVVKQEEPTQKTIIARLQARREERIRERLAERNSRQVVASNALTTGLGLVSAAPAASVPSSAPTTERITDVAADTAVIEGATGEVSSVDIRHDGMFSGRGWEKVRITLLDSDGNTVTNPRLNTDLVLRTAYGEAEFRPSTISPLDFVRGETTVFMLPRGRRTVVINVLPLNVLSKPMEYNR